MGDRDPIELLNGILTQAGLDSIEVMPVIPTIEDYFIKLLTT